MERALGHDELSLALGQLPRIPSATELQRLLADAELSLFANRPDVPDELVRTGWYLHAIASTAADRIAWPRRASAFRVSAHILELAAKGDRPLGERLECILGSELGYRRGGLDPNAAAVFTAAAPLLAELSESEDPWRPTLAVESAIYLLSFRTFETFAWLNARREGFTALRARTRLDDLAGTMFGPAEHVVEACQRLLRFLMFGDRDALVSAQHRLGLLLGPHGQAATINEQWVAAQLLGLSGELDAASVWTCLPPDVPTAALRALTSTSPPVLTLWEPQRELFAARGDDLSLLSQETRRAILSIPTSAGKTLVAQILVLAELARSDQSVCLVAPQRSLVREIRRALFPRVRALRKRLSPDVPDFLADFAADVLEEAPPDVDVMTPERFAALLRADAEAVLDRYGLFIFDEAHLVGDRGRGFTLEGALSYLHWRTTETEHRIVLMSAAIGNDAAFQTWMETGQPAVRFNSQWRGPRRLSAAFTTAPEWEAEEHIPPVGRGRLHRLAYPLTGVISFTVPGAGARSFVTTDPIGQLVFKRSVDGGRGDKDTDRSSRHYEHVAALASFLEHAGPVLTVTGTRPDAQRLATALASDRDTTPGTRRVRDAIAAILDAAHPLVGMVERGVGYHHAGLPLEVLALIEDELRAGRLQHLVSTTTLTEGVNLPVHTVILAETRWDGSDVHISGPRMLNALGRAGRAGIETEGWVVFAPSGRAPRDPERHLPNPDDLRIRSQLSTEEALSDLIEFEGRRNAAADAVFSELPDSLQEFTTFVWYVLACEEALANALEEDELEDIVDTRFTAQQIGAAALSRLHRYAGDVRTTYLGTDPARRRAWARSGTRIASAQQLDELAETLAADARRRFRASAAHAIQIFERTGVLDELLGLPDVPDNTWRFRVTARTGDVDVDLADALRRWTAGESLSDMADALLSLVPDREWRLEQMVDHVSRGFGHAISWMIATVLERANALLAQRDLEPICPALALYVRFGVDSPVALQLVTRSLRSREVAVRVARAALAQGVADDAVSEWLATVPIEEWRARFGAGPSDVLDLLDAISDPQTEVLRNLLDGHAVELSQSTTLQPGLVQLVVDQDVDGVPLVSLTTRTGEHIGPVGSQWQADLRAVLATGVDIAAEIGITNVLIVRRRDS
jgi:hypothetical protein